MTKWLLYITPFSILAVILLGAIIYVSADDKMPGEGHGMLVTIMFLLLIIVAVIDIILRFVFGWRFQYIWITEALLFLIFCVVFIKK